MNLKFISEFFRSGDIADVDADDDELPVSLRNDDDAGHAKAVRGGRGQEVLQRDRPSTLPGEEKIEYVQVLPPSCMHTGEKMDFRVLPAGGLPLWLLIGQAERWNIHIYVNPTHVRKKMKHSA